MKIKAILAGLLIATNSHAASLTATTVTKANQALGYTNQTVYLSCKHTASVTNNTGAPYIATLFYSICADNQGCYTKNFNVKVGGGTWHDSIPMTMYATYKHPGHYKLHCQTTVKGLATQEDTSDIGIS